MSDIARRRTAWAVIVALVVSWEIAAWFIDGWNAVLGLPIASAAAGLFLLAAWALSEVCDV